MRNDDTAAVDVAVVAAAAESPLDCESVVENDED